MITHEIAGAVPALVSAALCRSNQSCSTSGVRGRPGPRRVFGSWMARLKFFECLRS